MQNFVCDFCTPTMHVHGLALKYPVYLRPTKLDVFGAKNIALVFILAYKAFINCPIKNTWRLIMKLQKNQ